MGFAADRPLKIVAFGDSLTAGLGLSARDAFPAKLEAALKAKGLAVTIVNAGVSGDTSSAGAERLDWSLGEDADAVIVELGANDALRGVDPKITQVALSKILDTIQSRNLPVLVAGMLAPRNLGPDYSRAFDAVFSDISARKDIIFYPFFLDGVVGDPKFNQSDGMHPNAAGVDVIVSRILPKVEELVTRARAKS
jgi:acyl-CoA thioesterase-1